MPKYGIVGTDVTFYISSPFPIEGNYSLLWSTSSLFTEGTYITIKSGTLQKSTTITLNFKVPETAYGGPYFVQFFQPARDAINDQFTVKPAIYVSPTSTTPGTTVMVKGSGFPADDKGHVSLKNNLATASFISSSKGSFSAKLTLPELEQGSHEITATSEKLGAEKASASISITSRYEEPKPTPQPTTPPQNINNPVASVPVSPPLTAQVNLPKPVIITPREDSIGWLGKQSVTFEWGPVTGSSGISYNFEVGDNFNFEPPLPGLQKTNLTSTHYITQLPPGTYYWRVKAVDAEGHEGDWSYSPYPFKVGNFPLVPLILILVIGTVLVLVVRKLKGLMQRDSSP